MVETSQGAVVEFSATSSAVVLTSAPEVVVVDDGALVVVVVVEPFPGGGAGVVLVVVAVVVASVLEVTLRLGGGTSTTLGSLEAFSPWRVHQTSRFGPDVSRRQRSTAAVQFATRDGSATCSRMDRQPWTFEDEFLQAAQCRGRLRR